MNERLMELQEVATIKYGFPFDSKFFNDKTGMRIIRIRDINSNTEKTYFNGEYDPEYLVKDGDIVVGMDGEFNCIIWGEGEALLNQRIAKIVPDSSILDKRYLMYFLKVELKEIEEHTARSTVKHLLNSHLTKIKVPILPMQQQKSITTTLSKVDNARDRYAKILQLSKSYSLSLINKMFTSKKTGEQQIVRLKEVCDIFDRDHRTPIYTDNGIPLVSPANFIPEGINTGDVKYISKEDFEKEKKKCAPRKGDILFSRIGTIGEVRYAPNIDFIPLHSIAVIRAHPEKISHVYLYYILQTDDVINQAFAGVQSIGVPDLGLKKIENIEIPLPSLVNQERFAKHMRAFESTRKRQMQSAEKLDLLFASLSNKYFNAVN